MNLPPIPNDTTGTLFRDVIMLALAGFVTLVMLILPHINPVAQSEENKSPGNLTIELRWPDDLNVDVDLWVQAPTGSPVGYSNKSGQIFNLLRDDLGSGGDLTKLNYEFAYSRGVPSGEYTVNAHLYRSANVPYPIPITVVVSLRKSDKGSAKQILAKETTLDHGAQELTVFRFGLSDRKELIPGSVHDVPKKLRGRK